MLEKYSKNPNAPSMDETSIKTMLAEQETRLMVLQQRLRAEKVPSIVLFEGWDASGKGAMISGLIRSLDPRGFSVCTIQKANALESRFPLMHRFWSMVPLYGDMAILDRSWYREVSDIEDGIGKKEMERRFTQIADFEKQLSDDGYAIIKIFLHVSKQEQKRRLQKLEDDKATRWRATKEDWRSNRDYEDYRDAFDNMLERTNFDYAPWHVLNSQDRKQSIHEMYDIVINQLEKALSNKLSKKAAAESAKKAAADVKAAAEKDVAAADTKASAEKDVAAADAKASAETEKDVTAEKVVQVKPAIAMPEVILSSGEGFELLPMPHLADVDISHSVDSDSVYRSVIDEDQKRLFELHNKLYRKKRPLILGFEGWDAAGKGGAIKRLTRALDPRGFEVHPVAAPSTEEINHQYLWRFWNNLPKDGHIEIFDRTWYGRVMVERIEGFCSEAEWQRAYSEINQFERSLVEWGAIVVKFWLQISNEEQLRRFTDRQNTPEKQWKITDEDWRNREKWPQYEAAVDDMLQLTSTKHAPWVIVEANDKKFARIKVLETVISALEQEL